MTSVKIEVMDVIIEEYVEHVDVKVEEYEIESVPPQYEHFIKSEKNKFNNSGREVMIISEKTTVKQMKDSMESLESIYNKR